MCNVRSEEEEERPWVVGVVVVLLACDISEDDGSGGKGQ